MDDKKPSSGRGRALMQLSLALEQAESAPAETRAFGRGRASQVAPEQRADVPEETSSYRRGLGRGFLPRERTEERADVPEETSSYRKGLGRGFLLREPTEEAQRDVVPESSHFSAVGRGRAFIPQGTPELEQAVAPDKISHLARVFGRGRPILQEAQQDDPSESLHLPTVGRGRTFIPQGISVQAQVSDKPEGTSKSSVFGQGKYIETVDPPEQAQVSDKPEGTSHSIFGRGKARDPPEQPAQLRGVGIGRAAHPPLMESPHEGKYFLHGRGGGRGVELSLPPGSSMEPKKKFGGRVKPLCWPPAVAEHEMAQAEAPSLPRISGRAKMRQHLYDTSPATASLANPVVALTRDNIVPEPDPEAKADTVTPLVSQMTLSEGRKPRKDAPPVVMMGTSGQNINVVCNYIKFLVEPGKGVFLHEVIFQPDIDAKKFRFQLVKMLEDKIGQTRSFDGGSLMHLPHALKEDVVANLKMPTDGSNVKVSIRYIKQFPPNSDEVIRLYNVLFRKIMVKLGMVLHGQNFFDPNHPTRIPAHKLELWPGFITAIQEYEGGIMLNFDASYRALRTETVWQFLQDRSSNSDILKTFQSSVCGLMVITRYNNKIYRIDDIDLDKTPESTFKRRDGSEISYIDYYKSQYDITIKDVKQPLLKSQVKSRIKGEEIVGLVDLIPELCFLTGLNDELRQDTRIMKDIATHTRISPAQRKKAMNEFLNNITSKPDAREVLEMWGLKLDSDLIDIQGRRLDPEEIRFGKGIVQKGNLNADWSKMATTNHVQCPIELMHWSVFCTQRDSNVVQGFVDMAIKCGRQMGIEIKKPTIKTLPNDSTNNYIMALENAIQTNSLQIVVVVLPMARVDKYSAVKNICCVNNPIPSQVILTRTISKPDKLRSITQKIVLQMNCKVGGTLWSVNIPLKSAMIVGLDAYHDPTHKGSSVGAMVASYDSLYTKWFSQVYMQSPGEELMHKLEESLAKCLHHYVQVNGKLPETVVVYRDGLGDGQLQICENHEIPQLIGAMRKFGASYNPKFVFIVVQKRISTRVFFKEGNLLNNAPPGTVVDHTVTRKHLFDFFVVSQSVRQGTVTPTHYVVLFNSSQMKPDHIQRLSYKLSHLYYNWCGTVRVPAPCQYAHKLSTLIGDSVRKLPSNSLVDKLYFL